MKLDGCQKNSRVTKLFGSSGLTRTEMYLLKAGDLMLVLGMDDIFVGETVTALDTPEACSILRIDEPTC